CSRSNCWTGPPPSPRISPPSSDSPDPAAYAETSRHQEHAMPIATPEVYEEMLDRAKRGAFAYPAINVTSSQTLNAALAGLAEAESDGIVQVSTGGAAY